MSFGTPLLVARSARISGRCMQHVTSLHPIPTSYRIHRLNRPVTGGSGGRPGVRLPVLEKERLKTRAIVCQENCG